MDNTCPTTALTVLYTNVVPPTARQTSSTPSRPPSGGNSDNSGHQNKNNNKNRNGGHGDGNNDGNNNSSGDRSQTTASNGRTGTPWPTYDHLWQEHMTVCPGPVPTGQQHPHAFMATPGPYPSPEFLPGQQ
jgi:hypothetical protein